VSFRRYGDCDCETKSQSTHRGRVDGRQGEKDNECYNRTSSGPGGGGRLGCALQLKAGSAIVIGAGDAVSGMLFRM